MVHRAAQRPQADPFGARKEPAAHRRRFGLPDLCLGLLAVIHFRRRLRQARMGHGERRIFLYRADQRLHSCVIRAIADRARPLLVPAHRFGRNTVSRGNHRPRATGREEGSQRYRGNQAPVSGADALASQRIPNGGCIRKAILRLALQAVQDRRFPLQRQFGTPRFR